MKPIAIFVLSLLVWPCFSQEQVYFRKITDSLQIRKIKLKPRIIISLDSNGHGRQYGNRKILALTDSTITSVYLDYSIGKATNKVTHNLKYYDKVFIGYRHNEGFYLIGAFSMFFLELEQLRLPQ